MNKILLVVLVLFSFISVQAQDVDAYWQDINFNDTTLISSKSLTDKMVDFLYQHSCCDESSFDSLSIKGMNIIFGKAKTNMRMYEFVLEYLLNGYSNMGKSQVVDYLLTYPTLFEGEISIEEGLRLDSITEPYQKVKVGAKAPDYSDVTMDGKLYHLYDSEAKNIIVVFWSTDCEYCHDFLNQIRKKLDLKSDFELVTFALADNEQEAKSVVKKMRLPGYHFYDDSRWEGKAFMVYHVTSTPTIFVLDENKMIVCKPYDWEDLKEWLRLNK